MNPEQLCAGVIAYSGVVQGIKNDHRRLDRTVEALQHAHHLGKGESCWLSAGSAVEDVPMLLKLLAVVLSNLRQNDKLLAPGAICHSALRVLPHWSI